MANRNHDPKKTHEIALSGLLFALAMALSFIEGTLVIPGLAPGMKLCPFFPAASRAACGCVC